jgi:hypothetical protein
MARRPEVRLPNEVLTREQIVEYRRRLRTMSLQALHTFYQSAVIGCKLRDNYYIPSARHIQEFVQLWKELRKMQRSDRSPREP